jgi:hypothetical protein
VPDGVSLVYPHEVFGYRGSGVGMKGIAIGFRTLTAVVVSISLAAPAWAQSKRPTLNPLEKRQLPQHCWGSRHGEPETFGGKPEYNIPRVCGKSMNHLCTGHLYLIASQRMSLPPRDRRFYAQKAIGEFEYTKRHMTPECPLRQEVDMSIALARLIQGRR